MSDDLLLMSKPKIVRSGLVAEFRFDERSGQTLRDYTGNGYDGVLGTSNEVDVSDPILTPQGYNFGSDENDIRTIVLNKEIIFTGTFTIMSVYSPAVLERSNGAGVYCAGHTTYTNKIGAKSTVHLIRVLNNGTISNTVPPLSVNVNRMISVTRDASGNVDLYVNKGTANRMLTGQSGNSYWNMVGNCNTNSSMLGWLYYQLFYNVALTPAQIAFNFNALQKILAKRGVTLAA